LNKYSLKVIFVVISVVQTNIMAETIEYSEFLAVDPKPLPYGEQITLVGRLSDFNKDNYKLEEWTSLSSITANVKFAAGKPQYYVGRVDKTEANWSIQLGTFPTATTIRIRFVITGNLSKSKAFVIFKDVVADKKYYEEVGQFIKKSSGKSEREMYVLSAGLINSIYELIQDKVPAAFRSKKLKTVSAGELQKDVELRKTILLMSNFDRYIKKVTSIKELKQTEQNNLDDIKSYLDGIKEKQSKKYQKNKEVIDEYIEEYVKLEKSLLNMINLMSTKVETTIEITTTAIVSDIMKYAGIDYGVVLAPPIDELRQFLLISVYWGPVDDSPPKFNSGWRRYVQNRLSLTVGYDLGDLSGNSNSEILDKNSYSIGVGYRFNKYVRLSLGTLFYRSSDSNELRNVGYGSVSIDLTAYDALKGLVAK